MSTFSQYGMGSTLGDVEIVANESYDESTGVYRAMEEASINEYQTFEEIIGRDFMEEGAKYGFVAESTLESINESAAGQVWTKVKEFFKSTGEKIMGILKRFRDKIVSTFIRDGKELVKKYEKQVTANMNKGNLSKMKFKYAAPKTFFTSGYDKIPDVFDGSGIGSAIKGDLRAASNLKTAVETTSGSGTAAEGAKEAKPYTEDQKSEMRDQSYTSLCNGQSTDAKSFKKDVDAEYFEDVETKEGLDGSILARAKEVLTSSKKTLEALKKLETKTKKTFSDYYKEAEKISKLMEKKLTEKNASAQVGKANGYASRVMSLSNMATNIVTVAINAYATAVKKDMSQCRSLFMKAATYNGKSSVEESACLMEAVEEVSNWEVEEMFA